MSETKNNSFITYLISLIISLIIGCIIFCLYFFLRNKSLYDAINATSLAGVLLVCLGGLMFVSNEGFFDFVSYGFKQIGSSIFSKKANENNDFANYKQENTVKRKSKPKIFVCFLISGVVFLVAMIVLRIIAI